MKKGIAVLLIIMLVLCMAGCGKKQPESAAVPASAESTLTESTKAESEKEEAAGTAPAESTSAPVESTQEEPQEILEEAEAEEEPDGLLTVPWDYAIRASWMDEVEDPGEYDEAILSEDEPVAKILITADRAVTDVCISSVVITDVKEDGGFDFDMTEKYRQEKLDAARPLAVQLTFHGDLPEYAVSYKDADGKEMTMLLYVSGYDGSLILEEI